MKFNWMLKMSLSAETEHSLLYRDDEKKVQCEIYTPFINGVPGRGKSYYFIDGDNREFKSESELSDALEAREAELVAAGELESEGREG